MGCKKVTMRILRPVAEAISPQLFGFARMIVKTLTLSHLEKDVKERVAVSLLRAEARLKGLNVPSRTDAKLAVLAAYKGQKMANSALEDMTEADLDELGADPSLEEAETI